MMTAPLSTVSFLSQGPSPQERGGTGPRPRWRPWRGRWKAGCGPGCRPRVREVRLHSAGLCQMGGRSSRVGGDREARPQREGAGRRGRGGRQRSGRRGGAGRGGHGVEAVGWRTAGMGAGGLTPPSVGTCPRWPGARERTGVSSLWPTCCPLFPPGADDAPAGRVHVRRTQKEEARPETVSVEFSGFRGLSWGTGGVLHFRGERWTQRGFAGDPRA